MMESHSSKFNKLRPCFSYMIISMCPYTTTVWLVQPFYVSKIEESHFNQMSHSVCPLLAAGTDFLGDTYYLSTKLLECCKDAEC